MSESEEISDKVDGKKCGLCNENPSKYCCPRCEVLYCSLACYKSESHIDCSESFYRDCVNEELSSLQADDESKKKMIEILKRMQNVDNDEEIEEVLGNVADGLDEGEDSDDDDQVDLHERVKGLNLDDADAVWNALTVDERNEFEALMSQGEVGSFLPEWQPWWMYRRKEKKVEVVGKNDEAEALKQCPELRKVAKFSSLTTVKPSPAIVNNITNVLSAYAFIARYYMGDIDPVEGVTCLLDICGNLNSNANYDDLATAVESVAQRCLQSEFIQTDKESLDVMKQDSYLILQGPSKGNCSYYCKAALSHTHQLLNLAKSTSKMKTQEKYQKDTFTKKFPDHKSCHLPKLDPTKLKKCMKKVEFYLSYIEEYGLQLD